MAVNTTVSEFNAFLADDDHWDGKGYEHYDDTLFDVDGVETSEYDPDAHAPDAIVKILRGTIVYNDDHDGLMIELTEGFRAWKRSQTTRQVVISVPRETSNDDIREAIERIAGSIIE